MLNGQRLQNKGTGRGGARDRTEGTTTRVTEYNDRSSTNQTWDDEQDDSSLYETRTPSSARRYHPSDRRDQRRQQGKPKVARASAQPRMQSALPVSVRRQRWTGSALLLPVGIGMCLMLVLWIGGNWLLSVGQSLQDEVHYGDPRTFQVDVVVGHQDSAAHPSHFIALNLHGRIEVIEFPGGDPTHAKIYLGPVLYGKLKDQSVVTLTFKDINADGKVDMIIDVRDGVRTPFLNDGGQFRAVQPGEQTSLKI